MACKRMLKASVLLAVWPSITAEEPAAAAAGAQEAKAQALPDPKSNQVVNSTATCSQKGESCTPGKGGCCPGLTCFLYDNACFVDYSRRLPDAASEVGAPEAATQALPDATKAFLAKGSKPDQVVNSTATCSKEGESCTPGKGGCCPGLTCFLYDNACFVDYSRRLPDAASEVGAPEAATQALPDATKAFLAKGNTTDQVVNSTATCSKKGESCTPGKGGCCPGLTCFLYDNACFVDYSRRLIAI